MGDRYRFEASSTKDKYQLKELFMKFVDEFRWDVEEVGKKRNNASLKDLESSLSKKKKKKKWGRCPK